SAGAERSAAPSEAPSQAGAVHALGAPPPILALHALPAPDLPSDDTPRARPRLVDATSPAAPAPAPAAPDPTPHVPIPPARDALESPHPDARRATPPEHAHARDVAPAEAPPRNPWDVTTFGGRS
ncbi:MAG TPA: hypothetical protein VMG12_10055, partial [Polyangiaceae bacterium]|nr:hypothetical protein [Polyangiaceae bacterium]